MTYAIKTIDELEEASPTEIQEAAGSLRVRERLLAQMKKWSDAPGLTLEDYNEQVAEASEWRDCDTCDGTGLVRGPMPRTVGCIHPSSAHTCRLRLYFDVTGEYAPHPEIRPALQVTFAIGHALHDFFQKALAVSVRESNEAYGKREFFHPEARIDMGLVKGNTDGDIRFEFADAIWEIKSDGPSSFGKRNGPNPEHRLQAGGLYATGMSKPFIVYTYIEKAWPHAIKEYVEPYDRRIFARWWKKKGVHVQRAVDSGQLPIADATPAECGQCPYALSCPQNLSKRKSRQAFARPKRSR